MHMYMYTYVYMRIHIYIYIYITCRIIIKCSQQCLHLVAVEGLPLPLATRTNRCVCYLIAQKLTLTPESQTIPKFLPKLFPSRVVLRFRSVSIEHITLRPSGQQPLKLFCSWGTEKAWNTRCRRISGSDYRLPQGRIYAQSLIRTYTQGRIYAQYIYEHIRKEEYTAG